MEFRDMSLQTAIKCLHLYYLKRLFGFCCDGPMAGAIFILLGLVN